ncbi:MAG: hypothetical protein ACOCZR_04290 [Halanaerobiales bacterium]
MRKKYINYMIVLLVITLFFLPLSVKAEEEVDKDLEERMELIKASKQLVKEQKAETAPSSQVALFLTDFGTGTKEVNLGLKIEKVLSKDITELKKSDLCYVLEGIHLKGEDDTAAFFSLKNILWKETISPYYGSGLELTKRANYQLFTGVNITRHFYLETKFINTKGEFEDSEFYSAAGFQLNF